MPAGLLGTRIVLRGLGFFSHAVGTATFPGLVLADGLGFAAPLGGFGAALAFSAGGAALGGGRDRGRDSVVALVLAGSLALGIVLASDVFGSGADVETLLFGSLLLVDGGDIALAAIAAAAVAAATVLLGDRWLAQGFDPDVAPRGRQERLLDAALLGLIALATVATLTVVGALLVPALFVIPAVTTRMLTRRMRSWQLATVGLVAAEGTVGLWLSIKTDAPPGATIACVAGAVFALVALGRGLARLPRRPLLAAGALLAAAALAAGCGAAAEDDGQLRVVATTTQIGDWASEVGGEQVELTQLLAPNTDPHDYEPRPSDVLAVAEADLVFVSGDGLDDWAEEIVADSGSEAEVIDLGAAVPIRLAGEDEPHGDEHAGEDEDHGDEHAGEDHHAEERSGEDHHAEEHGGDEDHGHDHGDVDPHWWHDPRNAEVAVREIDRALSAADPADAAGFHRNTARYTARLQALDAAIAACVGTVPAAERKMVTDHDAFGYFANRYGIEVVGAVIPAQTTQAQASAKDLSELAETIEAEGVRAVFPESSVSSGVTTAIAEQTGASAEHELYGDSLGPEGSDGETYLKMEAANADAVVRGLSGGARGCPVDP